MSLESIENVEKDKPTIGLLICKSKDKTVVEYSLRNIEKPIGVSEFKLNEVLPEEYRNSLPSIEEIEAKLENVIEIEEK